MFLFCFFPPPRSLPSSVETKQAAILWANDSEKILGPQCVHSTLDSLALGTAFKCEGTMRQFKGKDQRFGSKIRFSRVGHPKCNVRILWTKHLSSLKSQMISSDFVWSVTLYLLGFSNYIQNSLEVKLFNYWKANSLAVQRSICQNYSRSIYKLLQGPLVRTVSLAPTQYADWFHNKSTPW